MDAESPVSFAKNLLIHDSVRNTFNPVISYMVDRTFGQHWLKVLIRQWREWFRQLHWDIVLNDHIQEDQKNAMKLHVSRIRRILKDICEGLNSRKSAPIKEVESPASPEKVQSDETRDLSSQNSQTSPDSHQSTSQSNQSNQSNQSKTLPYQTAPSPDRQPTSPPSNDHGTTKTSPPSNDNGTTKMSPPSNDHRTTKTSPPSNDHGTTKTSPPSNDHGTTKTSPPSNDHGTTKTSPPSNDHGTTKTSSPSNDNVTTKNSPPSNDNDTTKTSPPSNDNGTTKTSTDERQLPSDSSQDDTFKKPIGLPPKSPKKRVKMHPYDPIRQANIGEDPFAHPNPFGPSDENDPQSSDMADEPMSASSEQQMRRNYDLEVSIVALIQMLPHIYGDAKRAFPSDLQFKYCFLPKVTPEEDVGKIRNMIQSAKRRILQFIQTFIRLLLREDKRILSEIQAAWVKMRKWAAEWKVRNRQMAYSEIMKLHRRVTELRVKRKSKLGFNLNTSKLLDMLSRVLDLGQFPEYVLNLKSKSEQWSFDVFVNQLLFLISAISIPMRPGN